jgi:hypothetical protein
VPIDNAPQSLWMNQALGSIVPQRLNMLAIAGMAWRLADVGPWVGQLVGLMQTVMPLVDASMLRAKFGRVSGVLIQLLKANIDHELTGELSSSLLGIFILMYPSMSDRGPSLDPRKVVSPSQHDSAFAGFVRSLVACLGVLLAAQEVSNAEWARTDLLKGFYVLLSCFNDRCGRLPRVRSSDNPPPP